MSSHAGFVYMDENSIEEEFKCLICVEPFEKPMCTPCDHTFCQSCIEQWLEKSNDENRSCPTCRHPLSASDGLKPASRIITNRIDRYLVKCLSCQLERIPRGLFSDHLSKVCRKKRDSLFGFGYSMSLDWSTRSIRSTFAILFL